MYVDDKEHLTHVKHLWLFEVMRMRFKISIIAAYDFFAVREIS